MEEYINKQSYHQNQDNWCDTSMSKSLDYKNKIGEDTSMIQSLEH